MSSCPSHILDLLKLFQQRSLEDIAEIFGDKVAVHYYQSTAEEQAQYAEAELAMDEKTHGVGLYAQKAEVENVKESA